MGTNGQNRVICFFCGTGQSGQPLLNAKLPRLETSRAQLCHFEAPRKSLLSHGRRVLLISGKIIGYLARADFALHRLCSLRFYWSERQDLNLRPLVPQTSALPGCATLRLECSLCRGLGWRSTRECRWLHNIKREAGLGLRRCWVRALEDQHSMDRSVLRLSLRTTKLAPRPTTSLTAEGDIRARRALTLTVCRKCHGRRQRSIRPSRLS